MELGAIDFTERRKNGVGRLTWVACALVWGIGLRRLGCGCGRRLVTGSCVYLRDDPTGCPRSRPRVSLSIYLSLYHLLPWMSYRRISALALFGTAQAMATKATLPVVIRDSNKASLPSLHAALSAPLGRKYSRAQSWRPGGGGGAGPTRKPHRARTRDQQTGSQTVVLFTRLSLVLDRRRAKLL